ncbi:hypothetical protein AArcSl_1339 [Halalkaliarchaeum desulfuricum]|uniref:Sucrose-phosphatase C-terminal domain-containing protein n=1 Tax=Halalkaliarchaeum desulfuricum TaxID=2055893 RepID=A0A343TIP8_9EURY|nr:DUF4440 domain-containing protein [Halalkaliarchaeum desulfuricum]AUX08970.1 hypothetical protein AArcSl_1339 [Halalkaliarchaeum desulfuricum]
MPSHATCRREIESLHAFFVDWYTGQATANAYDRVERALGADFEMVTPDGERREYAAVVDAIRNRYADREPGTFDIEIRNVETRYANDDCRLLRYEEWQETPDGTTGRVSTVLFEEDPDAPGDVVWRDLHETWLDGPDSDQA